MISGHECRPDLALDFNNAALLASVSGDLYDLRSVSLNPDFASFPGTFGSLLHLQVDDRDERPLAFSLRYREMTAIRETVQLLRSTRCDLQGDLYVTLTSEAVTAKVISPDGKSAVTSVSTAVSGCVTSISSATSLSSFFSYSSQRMSCLLLLLLAAAAAAPPHPLLLLLLLLRVLLLLLILLLLLLLLLLLTLLPFVLLLLLLFLLRLPKTTSTVYLGNESAQAILPAASHSLLTPGRPVLILTLLRQASGTVPTRVQVSESPV